MLWGPSFIICSMNKDKYGESPQNSFIETDFRLFLQNQLVLRCEQNPRYSLRSFARQLGTNPATLSSILSRKRTITERTIKKFGLALQLSPQEILAFTKEIQTPDKKEAETKIYQELTHDTFVAVSDWHHDAILELTHVKDFQPDPKWIAHTLGISILTAKAAIERLLRLELLKIDDQGKWIDVARDNSNTLDSDFSSAAMRKYQKAILEKSIHALESLPRSERDHTSTMIVAKARDLKKAKQMIAEFRKKLATFLQRDGVKGEEVYQICVSLFPISNVKEKGRSI